MGQAVSRFADYLDQHDRQRPTYVCNDPGKRNVLLVGTSGRGKSSTGNLILGKSVFNTSDSMETKPESNITVRSTTVTEQQLKINVCDALTIPDERLLPGEAQAIISKRLKKCLDECPDGFHFIVFVFSYTSRVTPEEQIAFDILLKRFGEPFLHTHAITVFTHGESFELKRTRSNGPHFKTWYRNTTDPFLQKLSSYTKAILLYDLPPEKMLTQRKDILGAICLFTSQVLPDVQSRQTFNKLDSATQMESLGGSAPSSCDVELFIIGKKGTGKSSTANTILGFTYENPYFKISDEGKPATLDTGVGWVNAHGLTIKVVDGPGLQDPTLTGTKKIKQLAQNVSKGLMHCPNGFHALVLVMKYPIRFTEEEQKTVEMLRILLGADFIKNHCILVFTDGENFTLKNKNKTFDEWCQEQKDELRSLIRECNSRVVLFYNLTPDKGADSTDQLIEFAKGLGTRFTTEMFQDIARERAQFIQKEKAVQLKELIQGKINLIINFLKKTERGEDLQKAVNELEKEILKENESVQVVMDVKRGIQEIRDERYSEALQTFSSIESEGIAKLQSLSERILDVAQYALEGYEHLF